MTLREARREDPGLSLHAVAAPAYRRGLDGLGLLLANAAAEIAARGIDPAIVLDGVTATGFPTFGEHARAAGRHVVDDLSRLCGEAAGRLSGEGITFASLAADTAAAIRFLDAVDPLAVEAGAGAEIREDGEIFSGFDFILRHSLPHFYFHIGATALILRQHGLPAADPAFLWQP